MLKKVKPVTLALLFYAGLCYVAGVIRTYSILRFPYVVEYGESTILYQIRVLFRGIFPYNAHLVEQHNFFSYTPFFQYLVSLSASTPQAWLFNARLLNSLSLFGVGVLISLLYFQWKNEERKPIHFVLPLLLWLSWYPVFNWMALGRLDGLALLMQVLGLYFYLRPTLQNLFKILAMIAFVFAFFTKQSAVWIPASLIIYN
ncbi:MAG: hypothetical protein J7501_16325, partial [Bdellovibrio sp.]|nr:hypothetical protein [Bdellovibrio sp.]